MGFWDELYEGATKAVSKRLRDIFKDDKSQAAVKLQRGSREIAPPLVGYNLGADYGITTTEAYLRLEQELLAKHAEIEAMESYGDLSSALDVIADNATQSDIERRKVVWCTGSDRNIQKTLEDLFENRLRLDEDLWSLCRSLCKFGDCFEELLIDDTGVVGLQHLRAHTMRRVEDERGTLYGFVQDTSGRSGYNFPQYVQLIQDKEAGKLPPSETQVNQGQPGMTKVGHIVPFERWEIVHFRLQTKDRQSVYGVSVLDSARSVWKRVLLLEDSAMLHQLQKAQDRLVFYVDVGDTPPQEALAALQRYRHQLNKKRFIDPGTNQLSLKFNPLSSEDHILIPIRKGAEGSRVDTIASQGWPSTELLEFFQNRLYAAIKMPRSYLAQSDVVDKSPLASKDIQFARMILRIQLVILGGLGQIARTHLQILNLFNPTKVQFRLFMTIPSAIYELAQMEVNNARADFATRMDLFVSRRWILNRIFGMNDQEINQIFKEKSDDVMRGGLEQANMQAQQNAILAPPEVAQGAPAPEGYERIMRDAYQLQQLVEAQRRRNALWSAQELSEGNREHERKLGRQWDTLLASDKKLHRRVGELSGLLQDIRRLQEGITHHSL